MALRRTTLSMLTKINQWAERLSRRTSGGNYIPEIDGLRFLAIGSVLVFHVLFSLARAYGRQLGPWEMGVVSVVARNPFGVQHHVARESTEMRACHH